MEVVQGASAGVGFCPLEPSHGNGPAITNLSIVSSSSAVGETVAPEHPGSQCGLSGEVGGGGVGPYRLN